MVRLDFKMISNEILLPFFIACRIGANYFSYVDFTKSFPLSCLLSKANGLSFCINTTPILCLDASHSTMNVLPKSGVANIGVEEITSFKSENAKVVSLFHTNDFFFNRDVNGPIMHA